MIKVYLNTLAIRIWHWINTLFIIVLLVTGVQLRVPEIEVVPKFSMAVLIHKYVGFAMAASFLFWLVYVFASGSFRVHYFLRPADARVMVKQISFYLFGIFKGRKNPFTATPKGKFNPLQKIAYISVMLIFTPVIVITGILYSDIFLFRKAIDLIYGLRMVAALHVIAAYIFLLYFAVHIYMSTLGHGVFVHIKGMIVGYEEEPEEPPSEGTPGIH